MQFNYSQKRDLYYEKAMQLYFEEGIYGHSDGVVRYLSDGDLLFTKYTDPKYMK